MNTIRSHPNPLLRNLHGRGDIDRSNPYYYFWRSLLHVAMPLFLKARVFNRHYEPATGGAVYICNHQSFVDPLLMAFALRRPMNFMARSSLFKTPGFRELIESVNTFPVDRESSGMGGLKESMRRLSRGGQVVVFAEGTRTRDGLIAPFLPGAALLSRRAADWTVPVVIDGAFEAWPRTQLLPRLGHVVVQYGPAIPQKTAREMGSADFLSMVRRQMIDIQSDIRRRLGRAALKYAQDDPSHNRPRRPGS